MGDRTKRTYHMPTFYDSRNTLNKVLCIAYKVLRDKSHPLMKEDGFISIDEFCLFLRENYKSIIPKYLNRNHIIELYFKDKTKSIMIRGENKIRLREKAYICPPDILYFGTLKSISKIYLKNGIKSFTKGYIKLHRTSEEACGYAIKFLKDKRRDTTCSIKVDAKRAYKDGVRFTAYDDSGVLIVKELDKLFILDI